MCSSDLVFIAVEVKALLIGQSVEPRILKAMREHLSQQPEVERLFRLVTMQMGPDAMVAVKAQMKEMGSEAALVAAINRIEAGFKNQFPQTAWLFFEPDVTDDN